MSDRLRPLGAILASLAAMLLTGCAALTNPVRWREVALPIAAGAFVVVAVLLARHWPRGDERAPWPRLRGDPT